MKRLLVLLSLLFTGFTYADTINLHWKNYDGTTYQDSTCVVDSDLILPSTPPTRYGYTFTGWKLSNYIPIEYLESTGTQYIDTGIVQSYYKQNILVEITFQFTDLVPGDTNRAFGVASSSVSSSSSNYFMPLFTRDNYFQSNVGVGGSDISTITADRKKHTAIINTIDGIFEIDGNNFKYTSNIADINGTVYLFGTHYISEVPRLGILKIHRVIFKDRNNSLVRDFIPVLDKDGVPCMFDNVEGKFYYNSGTGNFIAGPAL